MIEVLKWNKFGSKPCVLLSSSITLKMIKGNIDILTLQGVKIQVRTFSLQIRIKMPLNVKSKTGKIKFWYFNSYKRCNILFLQIKLVWLLVT